MKLLRLLSLALCLAPASCDRGGSGKPVVGPGDERDARDDHQRIQGVWACESAINGDGPLPAATVRATRLTFEGDRLTLVNTAGHPGHKLIFTLDPAKDPREINIKGADGGSAEIKGIYAFEGDALTMCIGSNGDERPRALAIRNKNRSNYQLFTLRRERR